jgi:cytochrome c-type biogenesis protein CcmF
VLTSIAVITGLWVCASSLIEPVRRYVLRKGAPLARAQWGMHIAHLGVGLFILGATVTSAYNVELDRAVKAGDTWKVGAYDFTFQGTHKVQGPNYTADEGKIEVRRGGQLVTVLSPQKRVYQVQTSPMTEAAIKGGLGRDIFAALGDPLGNNSWSIRVQIKPMVRFLWFGALIMALGGVLAASDKRYRREALGQKAGVAVGGALAGRTQPAEGG